MARLSFYTVVLGFLVPAVALAAPQTFKELVDRTVVIMDLLVPTLVAASVVIYFFGIAQNVLQFGDPSHRGEKMKAFYGYGLLVLFVMVSVWGILRIMVATFFSSEGSSPVQFEQGIQNVNCEYGEC